MGASFFVCGMKVQVRSYEDVNGGCQVYGVIDKHIAVNDPVHLSLICRQPGNMIVFVLHP